MSFNSVTDKNGQIITLHPNPATDYVNINFGKGRHVSTEVIRYVWEVNR